MEGSEVFHEKLMDGPKAGFPATLTSFTYVGLVNEYLRRSIKRRTAKMTNKAPLDTSIPKEEGPSSYSKVKVKRKFSIR